MPSEAWSANKRVFLKRLSGPVPSCRGQNGLQKLRPPAGTSFPLERLARRSGPDAVGEEASSTSKRLLAHDAYVHDA